MKKNLVVIMLCVALLVGMLSGCGKSSTADSKSTTDTTSNSPDTKVADDTAAPVADTWTWPLAEKKELSIWIMWQNDYVQKPEDLLAIQEIEKKTNVHINWTFVNQTEAAEKFSLMIASGEYPDIIRGADGFYNGGLVKMVDDGVSIDLTDLVSQYMPTYSSFRSGNEKLAKDTVTDDNKIVALRTIASNQGDVSGEKIWGGPAIRQDWLDETGLGIPVTMDDWYKVLTAIKANHPECEAPLMLGKNGTNMYGLFTSAFGVLPEFYNDNGTVKYGPAEDGYKQWVDTFKQWYSEGLIDPNFITNDASFMAGLDYIGTGKAAAGPDVWGFTADVLKGMGYNTDEKFWISACPYPVMKAGDTPQAGFPTSEIVKETTVITSACKDVELAMRYLDYWYSEECMMLDSLGLEGETYVENADGTYSPADALKAKVEDGTYPDIKNAFFAYTLGTSDFGLYNWAMFNTIYEGNKATDSYDVWNTAKFDLLLPGTMTMTDVESQEYASIYTNILTLVQENTVQYILGMKSSDDYTEFVSQLHEYGIDKCIELKQAALDRYSNR